MTFDPNNIEIPIEFVPCLTGLSQAKIRVFMLGGALSPTGKSEQIGGFRSFFTLTDILHFLLISRLSKCGILLAPEASVSDFAEDIIDKSIQCFSPCSTDYERRYADTFRENLDWTVEFIRTFAKFHEHLREAPNRTSEMRCTQRKSSMLGFNQSSLVQS
ncbi:MAG: hypothetical protein ACU0BB_11230 [Paracoccaceae bacterium]